MIAVCVTFDVKPESMAEFMPLMQAQATNSLTREPECHRFDISTQGDVGSHVFLYELYTDRDAFDAHLASDHFKTFDADVADMVAGKSVAIYNDVFQG